MKIKVIANPFAGKGIGKTIIPQVDQKLAELGLDYQLVCTTEPWHAARLARQAVVEGYDVVAAAGGDGTCNEVINGLMAAEQAGEGHACLAVIGIGRGNDFAFGAGIPQHWEDGCRVLANGNRKQVDLGRVNGDGLAAEGRYFGNGIGIGFDAVANTFATRSRLRGFLNYFVSALHTLVFHYRAPLVRIDCEHESFTQPSIMVSIMNGRRMGGGFLMTPESLMNDGAFDLCIAHEVSRITILQMIPRFMKGTQAGHPAIRFVRARQVTITALAGGLPAHADGETLCSDCCRLKAEMFPLGLEVLSQNGVTPYRS